MGGFGHVLCCGCLASVMAEDGPDSSGWGGREGAEASSQEGAESPRIARSMGRATGRPGRGDVARLTRELRPRRGVCQSSGLYSHLQMAEE